MMWDAEDVFGTAVKMMKFTGFLDEINIKNTIKKWSCLIMIIMLICFYTMNLFISSEKENLAKLILTITTFTQALVKIAIFLFFHEEFQIIAENRRKFWQSDRMGATLHGELEKARAYYLFAFKTYSFFTFFTFLVMVLNACIFKAMPFPCWVPEGDYWKIGMIIFQLTFLLHLIFIALPFDLMFGASYMEMYFQFRLLNKAFSQLETVRDIKECHKHQHFLFGFVNQINTVFSPFFLIQYFLTIGVGCMLMTISMKRQQNLSNKIKSLSHMVIQAVHTALFCFIPSIVRDESDLSLISIWECNWYQNKLKFQKYILFIMMMSKSEVTINAGSIIEIDRNLFLTVFKTTFSMYTLMEATNKF